MFAIRVMPRVWIGGGLFGFLFFVFIGIPLMLVWAMIAFPIWIIVRVTRLSIAHRRRRRALRYAAVSYPQWTRTSLPR